MDTLEVRVPPETEQWLRQCVADGTHASVGAAVEALVAEHRLAELAIEQDDHLWAKTEVEQALASLARGEGSALDDVADRLKKRLAGRKRT
jgi:Arc/MetJ-type ribon-helix-helix transcriptional regulator